MSRNVEEVSEEGPDALENTSVYDFMYHDARRIASFLSQFDNNGHLTGIKQNESVAKGSTRSKSFGINANLPLIGGGGVTGLIGPGETGREGVERVYDPIWANALEFLDALTSRDMIRREIDEANIGQFVLVSGFLNIQDLSMLKDAWKLPSIQKIVKNGATSGKKQTSMTAAEKKEAAELQNNIDMFFEMIQIMPHSVHARILTGDENAARLIWSSLDPNCLVSPATDIALTYGQMMAGEWSALGILSARPEFLAPDFSQTFDAEDFGLTESLVGQMSSILAPLVRVSLGRPAAAFAITPLMIFREVA